LSELYFLLLSNSAHSAQSPIYWRIRGAADLVEILGRPIFAVHTEMPECATSLFAVSGLARHLNFTSPSEVYAYAEDWYRSPNLLAKFRLTGFTIEFIGRTAETLAG
jgi:hypothetical protein